MEHRPWPSPEFGSTTARSELSIDRVAIERCVEIRIAARATNMVMAILFYTGLGALVFYVIWGPKDLQPQRTSKTPHAATAVPTQSKTQQPTARKSTPLLVAGAVVGLLVVLGLAWAGGKFDSNGGTYGTYTPNPVPVSGAVWVDPHYRQNGTFVPGHWRSRPDGDAANNWSNAPNYNPTTGQPGVNRTPAVKR